LKTDVLVVGAGPAGTVTARYAAMRGLSVTVIEQRPEVGVPVRCGEFMTSNSEISAIFPGADDIESLFDIPNELRLRQIEAIRLVNPKNKVTTIPFDGYTLDRDDLDQYLAKRAVEEGAELIKECRFKTIEDGHAVTSKGDIEYNIIIGADGPGSRVAKTLGLPRNVDPYPAVTAQAKGDFDPVITMFFGGVAPGAYSWIIPKNGQANVGVGFSPKFASGTLSEYFRIFAEKHDFEIMNKLEGKFVPSKGPIAETVSGNGMVVGDAAGHVISVNGGGIPLAMIAGRICGNAAADTILNNEPLQKYHEEWSRVMLKPLKTAAFNKRMADLFAFGSDRRTGICMGLLGKRRLSNLIRCKRLFP